MFVAMLVLVLMVCYKSCIFTFFKKHNTNTSASASYHGPIRLHSSSSCALECVNARCAMGRKLELPVQFLLDDGGYGWVSTRKCGLSRSFALALVSLMLRVVVGVG